MIRILPSPSWRIIIALLSIFLSSTTWPRPDSMLLTKSGSGYEIFTWLMIFQHLPRRKKFFCKTNQAQAWQAGLDPVHYWFSVTCQARSRSRNFCTIYGLLSFLIHLEMFSLPRPRSNLANHIAFGVYCSSKVGCGLNYGFLQCQLPDFNLPWHAQTWFGDWSQANTMSEIFTKRCLVIIWTFFYWKKNFVRTSRLGFHRTI